MPGIVFLNPESADSLVSIGLHLNASLKPDEVAAWTQVSSTVLASDPVILLVLNFFCYNETSPFFESQLNLTRRHFFGKSALGVGIAAMAGLLNQDLLGKANSSWGTAP